MHVIVKCSFWHVIKQSNHMFDNDRHTQKQNTILKLHGLKLCKFFCKFVEYQNDASLGCVCIIVGHSLTKKSISHDDIPIFQWMHRNENVDDDTGHFELRTALFSKIKTLNQSRYLIMTAFRSNSISYAKKSYSRSTL